MKKVFIVYDGRHEHRNIDKIFTTRDRADTYKIDQDRIRSQEDKREEYHLQFAEFKVNNPRPKFLSHVAKPKWKSGLHQTQITTDMISERHDIEYGNKLIDLENKKIQGDYEFVLRRASHSIANSLGIAPPGIWGFPRYRSEIEIEEHDIEE